MKEKVSNLLPKYIFSDIKILIDVFKIESLFNEAIRFLNPTAYLLFSSGYLHRMVLQ